MQKKIGFSLLIGIFLISVGVGFALALPQTTFAKPTESTGNSSIAQKYVYVGPDEIINDNFVQAGETVDINGTINGDIIVAGGTVNINSTVQGDVIAVGGSVRVRGDIAGNVRVGGGNVEINANVGKNATVFGGTVTVSNDTTIGWSLAFGAGTAEIRGNISGHVSGGAEQTVIAAVVGGNTTIHSGQEGVITVTPPAIIKGDLTYRGEKAPTVKEGAEVQGDIIQKAAVLPSVSKGDLLSFLGISSLFFKLVKLFGLLVVGLVIVSLFKKGSTAVIEQMKNEPAKSIGWGIVYLILTPIIVFLLLITIIGAPLALIIGALYFILLYVSKVFFGLMLGYWILLYFKKDRKGKAVPLMGAMILGIVIFSLLTFIPYLGWLVSLAGIVWALGALVEIKKRKIRENN